MTDDSGKTTMAIGETDDIDAEIETYAAAAAITKGDPVYLSADGVVTKAAAAQDCIGIAMKTQTAVNGPVPVLVRGRVKVAAGGAITVGKAVYGADSSQRVLMLTDISVSQAVNEGGSATYTIAVAVPFGQKLGIALQTTTTAGDLLFIKVEKS
jgi:hypothetical protein